MTKKRFSPGDWVPLVAMIAAVSVWLWPIGVGGKMPIGGDVTQFSMGLMAVLDDSLHQGRIPEWNDLWGFGFPGVAESQMGVYYPPHAVLYRIFPVEMAYTLSLVFHTYFAAIGAYWAARRFGISSWGSALAGFCWSASGMFLIHLPHQWGYTTGSWMPWALGLGWTLVSRPPRVSTACLLAAVMALQILPGHFQFAFETQVMLLVLVIWASIERPRFSTSLTDGEFHVSSWKSGLWIVMAIVAAIPLSAAQLLPTWELAKSAQSQRTYAYLSAFPATPLHLSSYVAPNLFHLSPLWRPLAWDPFHAMPEEHRPYLGLVPLLLALGTIRRGFRRDPGTRLLAILAVISLFLSLGPYIPGFSLLIRLPGFSFFRAPARWGLATSLMLALLAGKGFDAWKTWPKIGRSTSRFVILAASVPLLIVGTLELAFASTEGAGMPVVAGVLSTALKRVPWDREPSFAQVMASTRRGPRDPLILTNLIQQGVDPRAAGSLRLDRERYAIYVRELAETAALLVGVLGLAYAMARKSRGADALLLLFVVVDLLLLSRHRAVQTAPIRPLTEQSVILNRLAQLPRGTRSIDGLRNLPMVAGVSPLLAYRTLDRPAMNGLLALASAPTDGSVDPRRIDEAMRALGASVRVIDPIEASGEIGEPIRDPVLATWLYGQWGIKAPPFRLMTEKEPPIRAFFVPKRVPQTNDPAAILAIFRTAKPLEFRPISPTEFRLSKSIDGPGVVIVSVLDDPKWTAWTGSDSAWSEIKIERVFPTAGGGAWQAVTVTERGEFPSRWTYGETRPSYARVISDMSWIVWGIILVGSWLVAFLLKPRG